MLKRYPIFFSFLAVIAVFLPVSFVLAQDFGLAPIENTIMLSSDDPRVIIGRIIQIILTFLGVILLGLVIYAGFLWMSSGGEEDKVKRAKDILRNAVIGLAITLAAWAITTFVLTRLFAAISGGSGNVPTGASSNFSSYGLGAIGACSVESVYPENSQKEVPRNTSIIITFKETIGLASVCVNASGTACACDNAACSKLNPLVVRIFNTELGDACSSSCPNPNSNVADVAVAVSTDNRTLVLTPIGYLGSQDRNTRYEVKVTTDLKKSDGSSMLASCSGGDLRWGFEVNTSLDLTPPQVLAGFLFPRPDNQRDTADVRVPAVAASGEIKVNSCPKKYQAASVSSVTPNTEVSLNYHGTINKFKVVISSDTPDRAQLFNGNTNALLGIADFNSQEIVTFSNFLSLKAGNRSSGQMWEINIVPEQLADTLRLGNFTYVFSDNNANNNIQVPEGACDINKQAGNIAAKLTGHSDVNVSLSGSRVLLVAKVAGSSGNNLILSTRNQAALQLIQFSGGSDLTSSHTVNDRKDTAMNTIIKIGFNEAVNPITLSGTATEIADSIRVVNATGGVANGVGCVAAADCRSYKCENSACVGDYVNGRFLVSSGYKTAEFISDNECGINGCGEKVYCLPPNSNLAVEIRAANLRPCNSDQECVALSPFRTCAVSQAGGRTCQDANSRNYPTANVMNLNGITDLAFNSLDGNRDRLADGPITFFNENNGNIDNKDSYRFSFFVNDQKELSSPRATAVKPASGAAGITDLATPVEITFNTLMMSSTLRSGGLVAGANSHAHKLINLRSESPSPVGYWIEGQDKDNSPLDGVIDTTVAIVKHSPFLESFSYGAQIGSGVKDVYQNCFKPSSGPGCEASWENPSCCFGSATSSLDANGNCQ